VHLDLDLTVAATGLAASAAHVEGEAPRPVAAQLRLRGERVELADVSEEIGVGGRVGTGRAADRRLVDVDDLVEGLDALDLVVRTRLDPRPLQAIGQSLVDDLVHQRRLARARNAGHANELPERELDVDPLQVVLARA
jgi:hypothetical protein